MSTLNLICKPTTFSRFGPDALHWALTSYVTEHKYRGAYSRHDRSRTEYQFFGAIGPSSFYGRYRAGKKTRPMSLNHTKYPHRDRLRLRLPMATRYNVCVMDTF